MVAKTSRVTRQLVLKCVGGHVTRQLVLKCVGGHTYDLFLKDQRPVVKMKTLDHYRQGMSSAPAHAKVVRLVKVHCVHCHRVSFLPDTEIHDLLKPAAGPQSAPN